MLQLTASIPVLEQITQPMPLGSQCLWDVKKLNAYFNKLITVQSMLEFYCGELSLLRL